MSDVVDKAELFIGMYNQGRLVNVHIDPRRKGVMIPPNLRTCPHIVLQYGSRMAVPITNMEVSSLGISAVLSFGHLGANTFIPWHAVFAIADDEIRRGVVFPDDVPGDVDEGTWQPGGLRNLN
jgi:stringent starvation protein B